MWWQCFLSQLVWLWYMQWKKKKKVTPVFLKIAWKAVLFLSIATVRCWALTWSWWSGFSSAPYLLCVRACISVSVCARSTSSSECIFVYLWTGSRQDIVCLAEPISVETQNEELSSTGKTWAPAKPHYEVFTLYCQLSNPKSTLPHLVWWRTPQPLLCLQ